MTSLLEINQLTVEIMTHRGIAHALCGVGLSVGHGEIHGIVGESGCGKSMTAKSVLRLHDKKRSRVTGEILFEGNDILKMPERELESLRGGSIAMVFQDPMTSLDPIMCVGDQIAEMAKAHLKITKTQAKDKALEMLEKVGLTPAEARYRQYPFELSGGMQQRVMIAMAISCKPKLLIADEPTTALDATIQAQILELVTGLSREMGMSMLLITHNFGIVAETCDRVSVMYAGKVIETGDMRSVLTSPAHPYTKDLIATIPRMSEGGSKRLETIPGWPSTLYETPICCSYSNRCRLKMKACEEALPEPKDAGNGHKALCFRLEGAAL